MSIQCRRDLRIFVVEQYPVAREDAKAAAAAEGKATLAIPFWLKQPSLARETLVGERLPTSAQSIPAAVCSEAWRELPPAAHSKDWHTASWIGSNLLTKPLAESFEACVHRSQVSLLCRPIRARP